MLCIENNWEYGLAVVAEGFIKTRGCIENNWEHRLAVVAEGSIET